VYLKEKYVLLWHRVPVPRGSAREIQQTIENQIRLAGLRKRKRS
jgi:hypothetical protein